MENSTLSTSNSSKYITPTKENPVFKAECDWFGFIETGLYKDWFLEEVNIVGATFALSFADAVNKLHEWISENYEVLTDFPKCKFTILMMDGTVTNAKYS